MTAQFLPFCTPDHFHRGQGGGGQGGRRSRGIDQGPRRIDHHIRPGAGTGYITAAHPGGLAQGPHLKIYSGGDAQFLRQSRPVFSQHTESVCFIHQQQSAEFILQAHDFLKRRAVPVHAENGFRHHQDSAGRIRAPQMLQLFSQ